MKKIKSTTPIITVLLFLLNTSIGADLKVGDKIYNDYSITKYTSDSFTIIYQHGISTIKFSQLPKEQLEELGFDDNFIEKESTKEFIEYSDGKTEVFKLEKVARMSLYGSVSYFNRTHPETIKRQLIAGGFIVKDESLGYTDPNGGGYTGYSVLSNVSLIGYNEENAYVNMCVLINPNGENTEVIDGGKFIRVSLSYPTGKYIMFNNHFMPVFTTRYELAEFVSYEDFVSNIPGSVKVINPYKKN